MEYFQDQENPKWFLAENNIFQKEGKLPKISQVASSFQCVVKSCSSIIVVNDNAKF